MASPYRKLPRVMKFGDKLREIRKAKGMSQPELAAAAKLSLDSIRHIEQGYSANPTLSTMRLLEAALGVDCSAWADVEVTDTPRKKSTGKRKPKPDA